MPVNRKTSSWNRSDERLLWEYYLSGDYKQYQSNGLPVTLQMLSVMSSDMLAKDMFFYPDVNPEHAVPLKCLLLGRMMIGISHRTLCDSGLVLEPVSGTDNVYRRIGVFTEGVSLPLNHPVARGRAQFDQASFNALLDQLTLFNGEHEITEVTII